MCVCVCGLIPRPPLLLAVSLFIQYKVLLVSSVQIDKNGRWIVLKVTINNLHIIVIFFKMIIIRSKNILNILVENFNTVLNKSKDYVGTQKPSSDTEIQELNASLDLRVTESRF